MEYFWYIAAAMGAGIGTGLAGLSAATVMVPILIVLCPSFSGQTGAYQATAIALASDILGSAVTAWTYARHRNIDLKRGCIMMICILTMCIAGSYVAWLAGNVVLGTFTLFLTLCIGIRFLIKPDTSRADGTAKGEKLGTKGILISLFFGLTIGFGTGFVGTGGGMMMLVVFTAFLGMELKTAVGTSTFIMTFTALIASVSHIAIHPAILLDRWDVMILCIVVATIFSRLSAQFANKVKSRTVGLVTGVVLTILGASMLLLHYWDAISGVPLIMQVIECFDEFFEFVIPCVVILFLVHHFSKIPRFVFRKCLHLVAFSCITLMILRAESWQSASLCSAILAGIFYPVLALLEKQPWYSGLLVQKKPGEIKRSMVMLFFMFSVLTCISWGAAGEKAIGAAAILMWGTGDAAAALVGIPFGTHKVGFRICDGKKSYEGSGAMLIVSFLCGFLFLYFYAKLSLPVTALCALSGAACGTLVELISKTELDTVTVPTSILAILLILTRVIK